MPHVSEEDRGTRAGGKSQLKAVMLIIFTHLFSLDIYLPLVGVDLRLENERPVAPSFLFMEYYINRRLGHFVQDNWH